MEMFDCGAASDRDFLVWEKDGPAMNELAEEFMQAKVWAGMTFAEAEPEIEWIG